MNPKATHRPDAGFSLVEALASLVVVGMIGLSYAGQLLTLVSFYT